MPPRAPCHTSSCARRWNECQLGARPASRLPTPFSAPINRHSAYSIARRLIAHTNAHLNYRWPTGPPPPIATSRNSTCSILQRPTPSPSRVCVCVHFVERCCKRGRRHFSITMSSHESLDGYMLRARPLCLSIFAHFSARSQTFGLKHFGGERPAFCILMRGRPTPAGAAILET